jgi:hypothetical protein
VTQKSEGLRQLTDAPSPPGPAPTMFAVQPLISTAERAQDAARLEARGGFNDLAPKTSSSRRKKPPTCCEASVWKPGDAEKRRTATTQKKTRVELGGLLGDVGGDDGGFSQFFNSQFSPGGDGDIVGAGGSKTSSSRRKKPPTCCEASVWKPGDAEKVLRFSASPGFHTDASQQVGGFLRRDDEVFEPPAPT